MSVDADGHHSLVALAMTLEVYHASLNPEPSVLNLNTRLEVLRALGFEFGLEGVRNLRGACVYR